MNAHSDILVVIYTGDSASQQEILSKAKERFGIEVKGDRLLMVRLKMRWIVEARYYPVLTLLGQSFGTGVSSCDHEASLAFPCDCIELEWSP
jgi:hypothetical protein